MSKPLVEYRRQFHIRVVAPDSTLESRPMPLADHFWPYLSGTMREQAIADVALEARLQHVIEQCQRTWPGVGALPEQVLPYVAARMPEDGDLRDIEELVNWDHLFLACACAHGDPAALTTFETQFLPEVNRALAAMPKAAGVVDEVKQRVRISLFVRHGDKPPKVTQYGGKATLGRWVHIIAMHTALDLLDGQKRELIRDDDLFTAPRAGDGAEVAYMKAAYRRQFEEAYRAALSGMPDDLRVVLERYYLDGKKLHEVALELGISLATASRRLAHGRNALANEIHRQLGDRLKVSESAVDSILRLIQTQPLS
jgi:RNA polymerase sigma-70 factor, ECF subfamily